MLRFKKEYRKKKIADHHDRSQYGDIGHDETVGPWGHIVDQSEERRLIEQGGATLDHHIHEILFFNHVGIEHHVGEQHGHQYSGAETNYKEEIESGAPRIPPLNRGSS
jgi:hypothetical protein